MSNPKFYIEGNKWFYENVRQSYKEVKGSYSSSSRVKYDNIGSVYRVAQQISHSYLVPSYLIPSTSKTIYSQQSLASYRLNSYG